MRAWYAIARSAGADFDILTELYYAGGGLAIARNHGAPSLSSVVRSNNDEQAEVLPGRTGVFIFRKMCAQYTTATAWACTDT